MSDLGFVCSEANHTVFYYDGDDDTTAGLNVKCIIGWHVDDGMGTSNSAPFLQRVKERIATRFGIKDLVGPITKYLGIQFERNRSSRELWMHQ
ncbi:hypothetical protein PAXINDRAFT_83170, partial [Paxillus involutus ATCC 200175]